MIKRNATIYRLRKKGYKMREIGNRYGISASRVSQLIFKVEREYQRENERPVDRAGILKQNTNDLMLPYLVTTALVSAMYYTLADIVVQPESNILALRRFGPASLAALKKYLKSEGLRLGMSMPDVVAWCNDQAVSKKPLKGRKPSYQLS